MKYQFNSEPSTPAFGAKPAGDYAFIVTECGEPELNKVTFNWVLKVRLAIDQDHATVFDNPWARSEKSTSQDGRDGIAQFLIAIGMSPAAGKDPNWKGCVGKKGRCRIKVEIANQGALAGKEVNKVAFYHSPKQADGMSGQTASTQEFEKARKAKTARMEGAAAEPEPDNLPY